jgi:hypothetical protein
MTALCISAIKDFLDKAERDQGVQDRDPFEGWTE